MHNLWNFFLRYYSFFLFIALEAIAFTLIINNNSYQRASVLNSANNVSGTIYSITSDISSYLSLGRVNDSLANENIRLRNQLSEQFYSNETVRKTVVDSTNFQRYTYLEAKIVQNSYMKRNNYITIDRGSLHGVEQKMGVISSNGIVGIIKDVSPHFSTIISFLHKDSKISAKIKRNGEYGSLVWDGLDPKFATLLDIPSHAEIKEGDTVTTTGYSLVFPENILIGIVEKVTLLSGDNFYNIRVRLSTNFSTLRYVYVLNDILAVEKNKLQEGINND